MIFSMDMVWSNYSVPPIQTGDKIWPLAVRRRQLRGGDQTAPEHFLLVFAVEQQKSREQVLDIPKQILNIPTGLALAGRHPLPPLAKTA
jgi:hypothetical protein